LRKVERATLERIAARLREETGIEACVYQNQEEGVPWARRLSIDRPVGEPTSLPAKSTNRRLVAGAT